MRTSIHPYICAYLCIICVSAYACMCVYAYTRECANIRVYIRVPVCMCARLYVCMYLCVCVSLHRRRCWRKKHKSTRLVRVFQTRPHPPTRKCILWCCVTSCNAFRSFLRTLRVCDMTHSKLGHDSLVCVVWLVRMRDMTHSYGGNGAFMCDMTHCAPLHSNAPWRLFMCARRLVCMCGVIYSYVWYDSFVRVTWHIHMGDMTRWYMTLYMTSLVSWHDSLCATVFKSCLNTLYVCDVTYSDV